MSSLTSFFWNFQSSGSGGKPKVYTPGKTYYERDLVTVPDYSKLFIAKTRFIATSLETDEGSNLQPINISFKSITWDVTSSSGGTKLINLTNTNINKDKLVIVERYIPPTSENVSYNAGDLSYNLSDSTFFVQNSYGIFLETYYGIGATYDGNLYTGNTVSLNLFQEVISIEVGR